MEKETIEKILNFLETNEDKQIPSKWFVIKFIDKLENHPDDVQYRHKGSLELGYEKIKKLPNDLYVDGSLDLDRCKRLTKLPDNLYVGANLSLIDTNIKELPDNLYVGGNLILEYSKIASLPEGLKVWRSLDLSFSKMTSLPEGLEVVENLLLIMCKNLKSLSLGYISIKN
jgi:hypothetical protein